MQKDLCHTSISYHPMKLSKKTSIRVFISTVQLNTHTRADTYTHPFYNVMKLSTIHITEYLSTTHTHTHVWTHIHTNTKIHSPCVPGVSLRTGYRRQRLRRGRRRAEINRDASPVRKLQMADLFGFLLMPVPILHLITLSVWFMYLIFLFAWCDMWPQWLIFCAILTNALLFCIRFIQLI